MIPYIGDFAEDATVVHYFNTFSSDDPSASVTITDLIDSDIDVYKDGGVTEIATDGATVVINFDSRTGVHKITIDTSVHSDYAVGSDYMVAMLGTTIDSGTVNAALFTFSIENRFNAAADDLANGTDGLGAIKAETAAIVADTNELQSDNVPGLISTLDAVVDTVKAETVLILADTADIQPNYATEAKQDILDTNVDQIEAAVITNAAGVDIAADIIALKAETATILADTNELQSDDVPTLISTLDAVVDTVKAETVLILADTSELQADDYPATIAALQTDLDTLTAGVTLTAGSVDLIWNETLAGHVTADTSGLLLNEWQNGGRLDLLLDAIVPAGPTKAEMDTAHGLLATEAKQDIIDTNIDQIETAVITNATGTDIAADIISAQTDLDTISNGIINGAAATGTLSTTVCTSNLSGYTDNQLIGRIITFLAGPADGESSDITDYADTNGTITFTAMTLAAENGNAFKIT